jgi:putative colanic acid biosynthesis glycosyltransferase WcaI
MKILVLNLYFPPDTSATAKMAERVAEALAVRHDVTVLCGRPSYDPSERRPWRLWQSETAGKVRIVRVGSTDYPRFAMKRRVINYLSYVALAVPRALFIGCDLVLAMTDPPFQGIVGAFVALLKRRPFAYNIRDLYPEMALGGALVQPGILARTWEKLHRWALRRAIRVIVLGEDMRARVEAKGISRERIAIVRDGVELPEKNAAVPALDEEVVRIIRGNDRFVFVHAGNLGFYGAWETLVASVRELADLGVSLVFVGDGAQKEQIQDLANGAKNVRLLRYFPANKIPSVLAAADAHVVTVKRGLEGVVVPSKMYGILAAGKPILAVAPRESDAVSLGNRFEFGIAADPDKPTEVASAMRFLATNPEKTKCMGAAARDAASEFDKVKELKEFLRVVEEAANT